MVSRCTNMQVAAAVGGRRRLRRRLTGWLHLSRSYVGRTDAMAKLHEAQPSALAYKQVVCNPVLPVFESHHVTTCGATRTLHMQHWSVSQCARGLPVLKVTRQPFPGGSAATSGLGKHMTVVMQPMQEGLPYASLPDRQNPRRHEAGGRKGGSAYLAPLHSRDKRWYIHAW